MATGAGLVGSAMLPKLSIAQDYPERPITVAMASPAGGATDCGTRPVLELMKGPLGARAIAAQDMSGAGGIQAFDYVMNQPTAG